MARLVRTGGQSRVQKPSCISMSVSSASRTSLTSVEVDGVARIAYTILCTSSGDSFSGAVSGLADLIHWGRVLQQSLAM